MYKNPDEENYLSALKCADLLKVNRRTILNLIKRGLLKSYVTDGGYHYIKKADAENYKKKLDIEISKIKKIIILSNDDKLKSIYFKLYGEFLGKSRVLFFKRTLNALITIGDLKPNILIIDFELNEYNSIKIIKEIKKWNKDIKIIGLSSNQNINKKEEKSKYNVKYILDKPVKYNELKQIIENIF